MKKLPIITWFDKATVKHLRFPFSFFLLPVFLFSLSQANEVKILNTILIFIIIHLLLFPSTNGYNSYEDKDQGSIGGLKSPPAVSKNLFKATLLFDILAIMAALLISLQVALLILVFIIMERVYSYRKIRLKKYPVLAFFIVFIFQGGYIYIVSEMAIQDITIGRAIDGGTLICMAISSLFIGSMYPLTQIYQHESDKNDGVISLSYKLGYRGTFVFSGTLFTLAIVLTTYYFIELRFIVAIVLFGLLILPVIIRMGVWFNKVKKNTRHANFDNTMSMNLLSSISMNTYFLILTLYKFI
jgi:1,4-dihydroxy-2-naphthoate octaprenyltransferase